MSGSKAAREAVVLAARIFAALTALLAAGGGAGGTEQAERQEMAGTARAARPETSEAGSHTSDWPCWRGPDHDGISKEKGWATAWPKEGPSRLWQASVGTGASSISVSRGCAFTMGNRKDVDTVFCLDAGTGKEIWKHGYSCRLDPNSYEGGPNATPTVDGEFVYTLSREGHVFCLEAQTGKVVWEKNAARETGAEPPEGWGFSGSPLVAGDLLILNVGSAGVALEKATGRLVWKSGKEQAGYATPVPFAVGSGGERRGVAIFSASGVIGIEPAQGRQCWRIPWQAKKWGCNAADPIFFEGKVFVSAWYKTRTGSALLRLDGPEPEVVWENKDLLSNASTAVLWEGHLYGFHMGTGGSGLRCLDIRTGRAKWTEKVACQGSLMLADGKLICLSETGELFVVGASPAAGKELARAKVLDARCWAMPVLAGGRIFCRNAKGDVVCLDVREGLRRAPQDEK